MTGDTSEFSANVLLVKHGGGNNAGSRSADHRNRGHVDEGSGGPLLSAAVARWIAAVRSFDVRIADLLGLTLGKVVGNTIWLDSGRARAANRTEKLITPASSAAATACHQLPTARGGRQQRLRPRTRRCQQSLQGADGWLTTVSVAAYCSAMQNKCFSPRISSPLAVGTGEAMTDSPILFSAKTWKASLARLATNTVPSSRGA